MAPSPFQTAIEALRRPLAFAAQNDFANLGRIKDLEAGIRASAEQAQALAIPAAAKTALAQLAASIDAAREPGARQQAIALALAQLDRLGDPAWAEARLVASPAGLPGLGPKRAAKLAQRGLASVEDLLFRLPQRYDDRREHRRIAELAVGSRATFVAEVRVADFVAWRGRRMPGRGPARVFEALVADETGSLRLKWFRASDALARSVRKGQRLLVTGEVKRYRFDKEIVHPEIELIAEADGEGGADAAAGLEGIVPDYALIEGIHPRGLRRAIQAAVATHADLLASHYEETTRGGSAPLPSAAAALKALHQPGPDEDLEALRAGTSRARERLVLEELFLLELGLGLRRASLRRESAPAIPPGPEVEAAARELPFQLTGAQRRVLGEILADLAQPHPMQRLLEGDVGSGKTVVAFLAAVAVAANGRQSALMAPTELLAEQHARTLERLAQRPGGAAPALRIARLSASLPRAEADAVRAALARGAIDCIVGTQALLQEGVDLGRLALAVIDEQHRFGVKQRFQLAAKAAEALTPHTLVMTATPIPRTLALTAHGDLDLSLLDEMPPGRRPVETLLLREGESARAGVLLAETAARGEQVYVVYPLVEASEKSDLRDASESCERIRRAYPKLRVDLVHGRLSAEERAAAMARFERGETQVLVATTVIEVGVDVPNATLMIVEHAERFGLAQLHQLRGRVGRGARPGRCVLITRGFGEHSEARMAALLETTDGFRIAEHDLRIRGPGDFLGTRQHGFFANLRIADLIRDGGCVLRARRAAQQRLQADPGLRGDPALARAVERRWGEELALAGVG